ncbi:uncharacterized protein HD556DRAFT_1394565, partial [Suillus plorans]
MRFSSAIVLAVMTTLASSISAMPLTSDTDSTDHCARACISDSQCNSDQCTFNQCANLFRLHSESSFCFHIGAVWLLTLTCELLGRSVYSAASHYIVECC